MQTFGERSRASDGHTDATVRLSVREAADALGVTVEAIRGRMHRGKYLKEKDDEGRVWVLLSPDQLPNGRAEVRERSSDRSGSSSGERSRDDGPNVYRRMGAPDEDLVEELRGEVAYLKDVVATRDDELRRKDTIIMQMAQRIPELEAPSSQDWLGVDESPAAKAYEVDPTAETELQTSTGRREQSWWRRWFGS